MQLSSASAGLDHHGLAASILVVEDDEAFRGIIVRMLERAGYRVSGAGDFASARAILDAAGTIDLMITDLRLPQGTPHGFSLARMAQLQRRDMKLIFMTGGDPGAFALAGPDDVILRKPFRAGELLALVRAALGGGEAGTPE